MTRFDRRAEAAGALAVLAAGLLVWALAPTYPNYDSYWHLVWGRELLDGHTPSFETYAAPTKHPLWVLVATTLGLIGESGDRALVLVCVLSHVALVVGVYRLGAAIFGRWPGLAAAVFTGASASLLLYSARGYVDMPFLAFVVWAAVLVAERDVRSAPGRARGAMALLLLAGLLRPEAWLLAGLLWLWAGRGTRLAVLAAAAPLLWVLIDLIATGDPLHSLHATSELADELERDRGLDEVPGALVRFLASTARPPVAALGVTGIGLAVWLRGWRAAAIPLALFGAGVAAFVGTGVLGLSILPRYLSVPAVALCVFGGFALLGFTEEGDPARRRLWGRASAGAVALGLVVLVALTPSLGGVWTELRFIRDTHDELVQLLDSPPVRSALACGPLTFPNYRLVPDARWHLGSDDVFARSQRRFATGVEIVVRTPKAIRRFGKAAGTDNTTNAPDSEFTQQIGATRRFVAYANCP